MALRRAILTWAVLTGACGGSAADHEALGDRAYTLGHFPDALVEYRLALRQRTTPNAGLRAKAGAAALRAGDLAAAAEEYQELAREGGAARATEAADGLERVARAAAGADDRGALAAALLALRAIDARRVLGSLALGLAATVSGEGPPGEALRVLPYAAAGAPDARRQDSLLYVYGIALSRAGQCAEAIAVFEGVSRRHREGAVVAPARRASERCALQLGRGAMDVGQPEQAEQWFRMAAAGAEEDPVHRAAYIGLGDVLVLRGDFVAAAEAYQRSLAGAEPGDSLAQVAAERLNALGSGTEIR
ncbi:MAG TPA: tetratricopeptide repeat protein [Gemmatimonadales bacterium]